MKLEALSFFNLASQRLEWLGARQKVIAENVANADTPGFKARDVSSFEDMLSRTSQSGGINTTARGHITSSGEIAPGVRAVADETAWDTRVDGNTVTLEQQTLRSNEVASSYQMAAQLYRKGYEVMTLAVSGQK